MKKKNDSPTPYLGKPEASRQMFTYSENKLLDQITTEIMEAWRKDLVNIRKCYQKCMETTESISNFYNMVDEKFPALVQFLEEVPITEHYKKIDYTFNEVNLRLEEIDKNLIEINKKFAFENLNKIENQLIKIEEKIKSCEIKKSWWQKILRK